MKLRRVKKKKVPALLSLFAAGDIKGTEIAFKELEANRNYKDVVRALLHRELFSGRFRAPAFASRIATHRAPSSVPSTFQIV